MKAKVIQHSRFIDPEHAGSFVGYYGKVQGSEYSGLTLTFADCSRKVDMEISLHKKKDGLRKLRNIIKVLQRLETELVAFKG